jgi:hypothetical protein
VNALSLRMVRSAFRLLDGCRDKGAQGAADLLLYVLELEGDRSEDGPDEAAERFAEVTAKRREWERDRKRKQRLSQGVVPVVPPNVPGCPSDVPGPVPGDCPTPLSLVSSENSRESESESSLLVTRETGTHRVVPRAVPANVPGVGQAYVSLTDVPTEEHIAIAQMLGLKDAESAWVKFCGKYADQWLHVAGAWQAFCVSWRNIERTERERERQRGKDSAAPLTADGLDPNSYEACQLRKKRAKAERDAEAAEVRARLEAQKASAQ